MKFCEECGAQLEDDVMFCEECGAQVEISEERLGVVSEPQAIPNVASKQNIITRKFYIISMLIGAVLVTVIVVLVIMLLKKNSENEHKVDIYETTTIECENDSTTEESVTKETDTQETNTNEEKYRYYDDFIALVGKTSDWPIDMSNDELNEYKKSLYLDWYNGYSFKNIVKGDDDELYYDLFDGAKYGVYSVYGINGNTEFKFIIYKVADNINIYYCETGIMTCITFLGYVKSKNVCLNSKNIAVSILDPKYCGELIIEFIINDEGGQIKASQWFRNEEFCVQNNAKINADNAVLRTFESMDEYLLYVNNN